ncbi:hypothetical protein CJ030_MR3G026349 [Morella rubra]|uniref:Protein kinase domain-containing protein n=1 Tax=Morella rubra TaxID=262757 RepID=A0A6A1VZR1_9ROSI|nr:hypothetical protein CJ030_MR3G026349 [Morella rubra]
MDVDDKKANILTWGSRLQIAIDAAQGLEYLHHGSKPPIVHRDVKCTNILLSENFQSKLADFGMSKIFPADAGSHVSTVVVGTQGYVDPEYYLSNRWTEKSDVYSFGVVLLRIITGRPVMERSNVMTQTHLSRWVSSMLANGDIRNIVDPRMPGNLDVNSVWKAIEIAMFCVSPTSVRRPNMSQVEGKLKECLQTEMAPMEMVNMDLTTEVELYPSASAGQGLTGDEDPVTRCMGPIRWDVLKLTHTVQVTKKATPPEMHSPAQLHTSSAMTDVLE